MVAIKGKLSLKKFLIFLKDAFPYSLAHHPLCGKFEEDTYHFGRWRLCIGCSTSYPIAIWIVILLLINKVTNNNLIIMDWWLLLIIAMITGIPQIFSSLGKTRSKRIKILTKITLGISMGTITMAIFLLPLPLLLRLTLFTIGFILSAFIGGTRSISLLRTCKRCQYDGDWFICPGFLELNVSAIENGLFDPPYNDYPKVIRGPWNRKKIMRDPPKI